MKNARDTRPPKASGAGSRGGKSDGFVASTSAPTRKFFSRRLGRAAEDDLSVDFSQSVTTNMDELSLGCSPDKIENHPLYAVIEEYMIRDPRVRALIEGIEGDEDDYYDEESATIEGTATHESSLFDSSSTSYYDGDSSAGSSILESIFASSSPMKKLGTTRSKSKNSDAETPTTIYTSTPREEASPLATTPTVNPAKGSSVPASKPEDHDREAAKCDSKKKRWPSLFAKSRTKEKGSKNFPSDGDGMLANELDSMIDSILQTPHSPKDNTLKTVTSQESVKDFMRSLLLEEETEIVFDESDDNKSPDKLWGNVKLWEKWRIPPSPENKRPEGSGREKDRLEVTKSESTAAVNNTNCATKSESTAAVNNTNCATKSESTAAVNNTNCASATEARSINLPKGGISPDQSELSSTASAKYSKLRDKHQSVLDILTVPSESIELPTPADPEQAVQRLQSLKERHHSIREIFSLPSEDSIPVEPESAEKEYEKLKAKLKSIRSILVSPQQTGATSTGTTEGSASKTPKIIKREKSPSKGLRARLSKRKAEEKSSTTRLAQADSTSETPGGSTKTKNSTSDPQPATIQAGNPDAGGNAEKQQQTLEVVVAVASSDKGTNVKPPLKTKKKKMKLAIAHQGRRSFDLKPVHSDKPSNVNIKVCEGNVEASGIEVAVGNDQRKTGLISVPTKKGNSVERTNSVLDEPIKKDTSDKPRKKDVVDEQTKKDTSDEPHSKGSFDKRKKRKGGFEEREKGTSDERKKDVVGEKKDVVGEKKGANDECRRQKNVNSFQGGKQQGEPTKPWYKKNLTSKVRAILPSHSKPDLELELRSSQQSQDSTNPKENSTISNGNSRKHMKMGVPTKEKIGATKKTAVNANGEAENVSMAARNVATINTSRCGSAGNASSSRKPRSKKEAYQSSDATTSSAPSFTKDKTNVQVEKNLKSPSKWKDSKSKAPIESNESRASTVTKTDRSRETLKETPTKSSSCNSKMEKPRKSTPTVLKEQSLKLKSTPAVLKDQSLTLKSTEIVSENSAAETTTGTGAPINKSPVKLSKDSAKVHAEHHRKVKPNQSQRATSSDSELSKDSAKVHAEHHGKVKPNQSQRATSSESEKKVHFEVSDDRQPVRSPLDPVTDASFVEKAVREMNVVEAQTEPQAQAHASEKAPLSIYRFLDFNPCHSELPLSPRSRQSNEGVKISGLCTADSTTDMELPGLVSDRSREVPTAGPSSTTRPQTPSITVGQRALEETESSDSGIVSSQDDVTPRAANRIGIGIGIGNPCGDDRCCDLESACEANDNNHDSAQTHFIRDAFQCTEDPKSRMDGGVKSVSQNLIRDALFCNTHAPQMDEAAPKSNCSRGSKNSVTFKDGLIDDGPKRSRSMCYIPNSKAPKAQPSALRRRPNRVMQEDDVYEESIEMFDDTPDGEANTKDNHVSLIKKMKRSLRKSPKKGSVLPEKTRVRDVSVCSGNRDVPESRPFVRASSAPSVRNASSTTTPVERLAVIRDEYTRARSSPANGGSVGDSSSKIFGIREEYKKARKAIARKGDPTPSVQTRPVSSVQAPHGRSSALTPSVNSPDGELTEAEKAVARRLANDLMILSKIARRRAMGKRASDRKVNDIERTMESIDNINRGRRRRRTASDDISISSSFSGSGTVDTAGTGNTAGTGTPTSSFPMAGIFDWLLAPENAGK